MSGNSETDLIKPVMSFVDLHVKASRDILLAISAIREPDDVVKNIGVTVIQNLDFPIRLLEILMNSVK